jgi:hypothetical protein
MPGKTDEFLGKSRVIPRQEELSSACGGTGGLLDRR